MTPAEVGRALSTLGTHAPQGVLEELFQLLDLDHDGGVAVDEFLARMRALQLQRRQKRRRAHRQSIHKKEEAVPVSMGVSPARTYW